MTTASVGAFDRVVLDYGIDPPLVTESRKGDDCDEEEDADYAEGRARTAAFDFGEEGG